MLHREGLKIQIHHRGNFSQSVVQHLSLQCYDICLIFVCSLCENVSAT